VGENITTYLEIGEVRYVHNSRAKNLSIRINQQGEVRVTIPRYVSRKRAERFLMTKKQWVLRKIADIQISADQAQRPRAGAILNVRGKEVVLAPKRNESSAEEALWRILLQESRDYLPGRIAVLASEYGYKYTELKIRKMKTRWGSCTARNSINLNSWLILLPDHLSDYVILHELAHTLHKDHGRRFWTELDRVTDYRAKPLQKELRDHRIMWLPQASMDQ